MKFTNIRIIVLIATMTMFFTVFIMLTNEDITHIYSLNEIEIAEEDIYILQSSDFVDGILAGLSILVTAILGYVTYIQTKEAMRLDAIDKTPGFQILNTYRFEDINPQEYHVGSGQYAYVPRLQFLICDSSDSGLVFKIGLSNVTENTIAKANIYYAEKAVTSHTQLKRLPISEGLNKVIKNSSQIIKDMECETNCDIDKLIESKGENWQQAKEVVVVKEETQRVLNEIAELNTPDIINCKKEEECEIELVTYFDQGEDMSKYINDYNPVTLYIVIDMETIHGYRYTQVFYLVLRYANIYSIKKDGAFKLVFSIQDFDSKVMPVALEKVDWKKACYNKKKSVSKRCNK